jgi:hypothetical protein
MFFFISSTIQPSHLADSLSILATFYNNMGLGARSLGKPHLLRQHEALHGGGVLTKP